MNCACRFAVHTSLFLYTMKYVIEELLFFFTAAVAQIMIELV